MGRLAQCETCGAFGHRADRCPLAGMERRKRLAAAGERRQVQQRSEHQRLLDRFKAAFEERAC